MGNIQTCVQKPQMYIRIFKNLKPSFSRIAFRSLDLHNSFYRIAIGRYCMTLSNGIVQIQTHLRSGILTTKISYLHVCSSPVIKSWDGRFKCHPWLNVYIYCAKKLRTVWDLFLRILTLPGKSPS